jgi:hypothetical protein
LDYGVCLQGSEVEEGVVGFWCFVFRLVFCDPILVCDDDFGVVLWRWRDVVGCCFCSGSVLVVFGATMVFGVGGMDGFSGSVLWMMEVFVAPAMILVVACCSGDGFGGDGF